jgi:hypothetical protein
MSEKKRRPISAVHPNLIHFRSAEDVSKPLCNSTQPNPKFSEEGNAVTCHSCQRKAKK